MIFPYKRAGEIKWNTIKTMVVNLGRTNNKPGETKSSQHDENKEEYPEVSGSNETYEPKESSLANTNSGGMSRYMDVMEDPDTLRVISKESELMSALTDERYGYASWFGMKEVHVSDEEKEPDMAQRKSDLEIIEEHTGIGRDPFGVGWEVS